MHAGCRHDGEVFRVCRRHSQVRNLRLSARQMVCQQNHHTESKMSQKFAPEAHPDSNARKFRRVCCVVRGSGFSNLWERHGIRIRALALVSALLSSIPATHGRVPHISLVFCEMWDTAGLPLEPAARRQISNPPSKTKHNGKRICSLGRKWRDLQCALRPPPLSRARPISIPAALAPTTL